MDLRYLYFLSTFVFSYLQTTSSFAQCTYTLPITESVFDGAALQPGDVVCLEAGERSYLLFKNLKGTAENPIIIVNKDGQVLIDTDHFYGVKFSGCSYIALVGNGVYNIMYGLKINRVGNGAGISIDDLSTNIELANIEISNTAIGGIYAKTDPDCTFRATRDKFTMFDLSIHDCFLHDIRDEGMYIGSSKFTGQSLTDCDTVVLPHVIKGVKVYHNIIETTGWDGIQVSSAPTDCEIYGNIIRNDSYRQTQYQMSGILIGGGSECDCFNNQIYDGMGDGIDIFGSNEMKIYNNLIVRAGRLYFPNDPSYQRHGIFFGNPPDQSFAKLTVLFNTIVQPKTNGIKMFNTNTTGNVIQDNIISEPGALVTQGDLAYVNHNLSIMDLTMSYNLFTSRVSEVGFVNVANDQYDLKSDSQAVNTGITTSFVIPFDLLLRERPFHTYFDKGAFECHDPFAQTEMRNEINNLRISPNPAVNILMLEITATKNQLTYYIIDLYGNVVDQNILQPVPSNKLEIDISTLAPSSYQIVIKDSGKRYSANFIKINE